VVWHKGEGSKAVAEGKARYQLVIQSWPAKAKALAASYELLRWQAGEQGFEEDAVAWVISALGYLGECHPHTYASCSSVVTVGGIAKAGEVGHGVRLLMAALQARKQVLVVWEVAWEHCEYANVGGA
jgi:hypothetical protein